MELGRRQDGGFTPFFDDVDRAYVVAQLEGAMDEPVDLRVSVRQPTSSLLLPGAARTSNGSADEARRAQKLAFELASLEPRIRVTMTNGEAAGDVPVFSVDSRAGGGVRFVGVPRVNLFRLLLETIRRASNGDHGLEPTWTRALAHLPSPVHARVFATPT